VIWLPSVLSLRRSRKSTPKPRRRLVLEQLEVRVTPSTLIPVTNRHDLVYDATRNVLYITTTSGQIQRWDVASQTLLSPWTIGTSLNGADITPDNSTLYVTENQTSGSQGVLHKVNLADGTVTNLTYNLGGGEAGGYDIAVANNGKALFTARFNGSGFMPLHELDIASGTITNRMTITQDTHVRRGADGSLLFVTESNISNGPILTYDPATDSFPHSANTADYYDNQSLAVSRNGSLIATQLGYGPSFYYGVSVMDRNFHSVHTFAPNFNGGLTFDPARDLFYLADAAADQVVAFDTTTWAEKFRLNIGEAIPRFATFGSGEMAVSADSSELFISTPSGVRMIDLPQSTGVASQLDVSGFPSLISAGTTGTFTVTARDPAGNVVPGFTGTVHFSTTDPAAVLDPDYTFTPADNGVQTFHATFGTAGTYTLTASDDGDGISGSEANIRVHTDNLSVIPVTNRRDLITDPVRGLLYITTGDGLVQRYDPTTQTLLAPFHVGAGVYGADITPDGNYLYATESVRGATQGMIHQVNLNDGTVTNLIYDLAGGEGGTWDVAVANNGKALFTSRFEGSGFLPIHELDVASGTITNRQTATQDVHVRRAADGSFLFLTESNISSGPILTYDPATDSFPHSANTNAFYDNQALSVNRNGSLIATQLGYGPSFYYGVSVMDKNFHSLRTFAPNFNGGLAFDPARDYLYLADAGADQVVAFDTNTWAEKFRVNIGEAIGHFATFGTGEMTVSADGSVLFFSTASGVRVLALPSNPGVVTGFQISGFPSFTSAGTPGTFTVTAVDGFGNAVAGYTGTVHFSSTDPSAQLPDDYPFTPGDQGSHTFTATFNTPGTYTLRVEQADDPTLFATQMNIVIHDNGPVSLIPVLNRRATVYDPARGLLYITTSDGLVQRYDPTTGTLLAPWHVGAGLWGADITPDGNFLYTTEAVRGATQGMLHKVNLNDGTVTSVTYDLSFYEGGTWAVAIANNGKALFTGRFEGSGFPPVHELDLATDTVANRMSVTQDTHVRRGEARNLLFLMESNISNGPILTYDPATDSFPHNDTTNFFLDGSTGSVSRDGSLIAMKLGGDVRVMDASLHVVTTLHNLGGGLVFDTTRNVLYAATSTQIIAYDTATWTESHRFDIGQTVPSATPYGNGEMTVSDDGTLLFFSTPTGVRVYALGGGGSPDAPFSPAGAGNGFGQPVPPGPRSVVATGATDAGGISAVLASFSVRPPTGVAYEAATAPGTPVPADFTASHAFEAGSYAVGWRDVDPGLAALAGDPAGSDPWAALFALSADGDASPLF
jgi:ribosomal protein L24E/6-phosphogluconolactonase (cycloisomerase 2 family)